jgi:hypothetical protein
MSARSFGGPGLGRITGVDRESIPKKPKPNSSKGNPAMTTIARRAALAAASTATLAAGLAGTAGAASAAVNPDGYVIVQTCTSLSGTVHLTPGLKAKAHAESAIVSGTLDGCSSYGSQQPGQGSFTAVVSGTASTTAGTLSGSFTANWPASSGLNPSNGTITITTLSKGQYAVSGSVTSGAWTGTSLSTGYVVTGTTGTGKKHDPITAQNFVNTSARSLGRTGG